MYVQQKDFAVKKFSKVSVWISKISNKHRLSLLTLRIPDSYNPGSASQCVFRNATLYCSNLKRWDRVRWVSSPWLWYLLP